MRRSPCALDRIEVGSLDDERSALRISERRVLVDVAILEAAVQKRDAVVIPGERGRWKREDRLPRGLERKHQVLADLARLVAEPGRVSRRAREEKQARRFYGRGTEDD